MAVMDAFKVLLTPTAVVCFLVFFVARFFYVSYHHRKLFRNLPGPPHSWLWGSLASVGPVQLALPHRVHPQVMMTELKREYNLPGVFTFDTWPFKSDKLLVVSDPKVAQECTVEPSLPKPPLLGDFLDPIAQKNNMVAVNGEDWKRWRKIFNPGFSANHLMTLVPLIVEKIQIFIHVMDDLATKRQVFRLEDRISSLTLDIIGQVVLQHSFDAQTSENEFISILNKQLAWLPDVQSVNPFHRLNPIRPIVQWYYSRKAQAYVGKALDQRMLSNDTTQSKNSGKRPVIDLALEAYRNEQEGASSGTKRTLGAADYASFRKIAIEQFRIFLLAGFDTSSSVICFCYHLLAKHPAALAAARAELDAMLGTDVSKDAELISANPAILYKLDYITAAIRETMRLYPSASTIRQGVPGHAITNPATGERIPTDGFQVWIVSHTMNRDPALWGERAGEFVPERFLPGEAAARLPKDGFRPFEKGPRNCLGQELAMIEMRAVLALTLRRFDVATAYGEQAALRGDGSLYDDGVSHKERRGVYGDPAYQTLYATAKPSQGMPARVTRREGW